MTMISDILPDHFWRYFVSYYVGEISAFPQLLLYFRMFSEHYTRAYALQHPHYFTYAIPRWKRQKYVNMILGYLQFIYLEIMIAGNFSKCLSNWKNNMATK